MHELLCEVLVWQNCLLGFLVLMEEALNLVILQQVFQAHRLNMLVFPGAILGVYEIFLNCFPSPVDPT